MSVKSAQIVKHSSSIFQIIHYHLDNLLDTLVHSKVNFFQQLIVQWIYTSMKIHPRKKEPSRIIAGGGNTKASTAIGRKFREKEKK